MMGMSYVVPSIIVGVEAYKTTSSRGASMTATRWYVYQLQKIINKSIIRAYLRVDFSMWVPPHLGVTTTLPISFLPVISVTKLEGSNVGPFQIIV
jgi:hypothetical protein